MANDLVITGDRAVVPAHLKDRLAGRAGNVMDMSINVPQLTFAGKVWTVNIGSEKIKLISKNTDGDEQPVNTIPVVIVDYAKARGRSFYEDAYDVNNPAPPDCWSSNSIVPDASITEPVSPRCEGCAKSIKGSHILPDGTPGVACRFFRDLAVILAPHVKKEPLHILRMRIAQTSDYDGQNKEAQAKGYYGFSNYLTFLKNRGFEHTHAMITKMSFDPNVAYPKIFFRTDRWLDASEFDVVDNIAPEAIRSLLGAEVDMPAGGRQLLPPAATAAPAAQEPKPDKPKGGGKGKGAKTEQPAAPAAETGSGTMTIEGDAATLVEEDEDDKAIRLAQERKAAKAAAAAKGTEKPAETTTKPSNAPTEAKEVPGDVGDNLGDLLRDFG